MRENVWRVREGCVVLHRLLAVEVVARDDGGATLGVFVRWAVLGIVAATDASTFVGRLDELDIVFVSKALTAFRVALSASTTARVVLATTVLRVETAKLLRSDTSRELDDLRSTSTTVLLQRDIAPEIVWETTLLAAGSSCS
jgi:hypothetical protein